MYFRNLVLSAVIIAIIAGLFLSLYQYFVITPIILASEVYEIIEPIKDNTVKIWSPEDGIERSSFSFVANFLLCFAYGLLLLSAMAIKNSITLVQGIFWGLAAYLSIFIAPALGLAPEIPGMEAAHLEGRQTWWIFTVLSTIFALWLIAFKPITFKAIGGLLLIVPHLIGAPQATHHGFVNTNPQAVHALTALWHDFILQTSLANALLWLIIGSLSAFLTAKFIYPLNIME